VRLEEGDSVVFFRIVWFFCQWWRISRKDELGHLIFTMDVFSFKLVLGAMDNYMERKKYPQLAQAVGLYSEMMHLLHIMYSSKDSTENVMALGLLDTLFYGSEPLDRLPKLLSKWAPSTTTREYLCDLVEVVHMTLKLLETNATACLQADAVTETKGDSKAEKKRDAVARMKANAATFDPNNSYILRKIVSNQVVSIYTHLLSQYSVNAPHVNHRIIAFLMRFQKLTIAVAEEDSGGDEQLSLLSSKTVTLEPMLFNVNLLMVLEKILNDKSIRKEKDFTHLLSFAARLVRHFADAAKGNPLLYVESLFRHSAPHRFCESFTNKYVNEELRLIADRDILLEDDRRRTAEDFEEIDDNQTAAGIVRSSGSRADEVLVDSDEEEVEWVDAGQTTGRSSPSKKLKTKRKAAKKKETVLSDSEDDDESNGPPSKEETAKKRNLDSPEIYGEEQDEGVVDKTTKGSSAPAFEDSSDDEFGVASGPTSVKKTFLDDSSDEEIDFSSPRTKMTHEKSTSLGKDEHFKSSKRVREEEDGDDSAIKNRKMNTIEESSSSQNGDKGESSDEEEF
jgi:timeless